MVKIMVRKLEEVKRIVVKIGTSSITYANGKLNLQQIAQLTDVITDLTNQGYEVMLVSSGAMGAGMGVLRSSDKPMDLAMKQATAAVGQAHLMQIYQRYFNQNAQNCAQILLTKDVLDNDIRRKNVVRTLSTLFELGVVPIINENDTVSTDEIIGVLFSDNDQLSSIVSVISEADLLLILTNTDGLLNKEGQLVPFVEEINDDILGYVSDAKSNLGRGGMITKLSSIKYATENGVKAVICNSHDLNNIHKIVNGEEIGTYFKENE